MTLQVNMFLSKTFLWFSLFWCILKDTFECSLYFLYHPLYTNDTNYLLFYFFIFLWKKKLGWGRHKKRLNYTTLLHFFVLLMPAWVSPRAAFSLQFAEMRYVGFGWVSTLKLITRNISPHDGWVRRWFFKLHIFPKKELGKIKKRTHNFKLPLSLSSTFVLWYYFTPDGN